MLFQLFKAYLLLIYLDIFLACGNFRALYSKVRSYRPRKQASNVQGIERICHAVDLACIWYWKEVRCLQRSAAAACLLKAQGQAAQLVIGVQQFPFRAHAWVEVDGRVVNDKPYLLETYAVLDRC